MKTAVLRWCESINKCLTHKLPFCLGAPSYFCLHLCPTLTQQDPVTFSNISSVPAPYTAQVTGLRTNRVVLDSVSPIRVMFFAR